jgi:hypothetical protein
MAVRSEAGGHPLTITAPALGEDREGTGRACRASRLLPGLVGGEAEEQREPDFRVLGTAGVW